MQDNSDWNISEKIIITNRFSLPINRIDTIKLKTPVFCKFIGVICIITAIVVFFGAYDEYRRGRDGVAFLVISGIVALVVSVYFFEAVKLFITSGGEKYTKSALFIPSERTALYNLKKIIEDRINNYETNIVNVNKNYSHPEVVYKKESTELKKTWQELKLEEDIEKIIKWASLAEISESIIPKDKDALIKIKELNLSYINTNEFPSEIKHIRGIKNINISGNNLDTLPEFVTDLPNLEYLDLSFNNIKDIPPSINKMHALKVINLSENKLQTIPEILTYLPNIKELYLAENELESLPDYMLNFKKLELIDISGNEISNLHDFIDELPNLNIRNV